MRKVALAAGVLLVAGCAIFGGGRGPDPLAGWGGLWVGEYRADSGGFGALEFEFSVDTAGLPSGVARFDRGAGMEEVPLEASRMTADSMRTVLRFDGLMAEIRGVRTEARAQGTYVVRTADQAQDVDSGVWEAARGSGSD